MPPAERKKILLNFADLIEAESDELALIEANDAGKPSFATPRANTEDAAYGQRSARRAFVAVRQVKNPAYRSTRCTTPAVLERHLG